MNSQSKTTFVVLAVAVAAVFIASTVLVTTEAEAKKKRKELAEALLAAPIATSGDNVYITWWSNKTGNMEVMFRASTDNGVIFGDKLNLRNTTEVNSENEEIEASGDIVI